MNQELLRIVDGLARDKNIDKETVFEDLEAAMLSAIRKAHSGTDDIDVLGVWIGLANGRQHGRFQVLEHHLPVDILVPGDAVYDTQQFLVHMLA